MTQSRAAEVGRGIVSLLTLILLTVGPPVALVVLVGWPLPRSAPTLTEIDDALRLGIGDAVVVKTLAVLAWLAWFQVAVSILVEAAAVLRGRAAGRLPILPGVQASVGRLIAGVTLLGSTTLAGAHFPAGAATTARPEPVALVSTMQPPEGPAAVAAANNGPPPPPSAPAAPAATATIEVRPHDSYWAIAERAYGDGLRWREIRDANVGRTMPDGTVIDARSDLLMPGWVLHLPAGTPSPPTPRPTATVSDPSPPTAPAEATATPGDSMWILAEQHLHRTLGRPPTNDETAAYCGPFIDANRDRLADPANPDLIYPGQTFLLPPDPAGVPSSPGPTPADPTPPDQPPPPSASPLPVDPGPVVPPIPPTTEAAPTTTAATPPTTEAAPTTTPPASDTPPASATPTGHGDPEGDQSDLAAVALAAVASAALAVGITREVRRRRRRRNHQSPTTVPLPPPDEPFHRRLLAAADEDSVDLLASAMADLAGQLAESDQRRRPRIVQQGPGHIDVFLDRPASPALGRWRSTAEGQVWTLNTAEADGDVDGARRWMTPAPLLVSVGCPDDAGQLYIDLETAAVTTLTGDPTVALDLLRTIATEVAHSPLGEATQVLVVGELGPSSLLAETEQVTVIDSWESVLVDLTHWATQSRAALDRTGHTDPFTARADEPQDDALLPLLVLATEPPSSPETLAFLHSSPAAVAVVVIAAAGLPSSTVIDCAIDVLHLPQFNLSCTPQALDEDTAAQVAELLHAASDPAGTELALSLDLLSSGNGNEPDHHDPAPPEYEDVSYDILVRFLGDITVEGDLSRRLVGKEFAAVSYIALHRSVTIDRVEDALWAAPTTDTRRERLFHIMSQARNAVGLDRLPTADDGRYSVGPTVRTDLELFDARVAAAAAEPRQDVAADLLLGALGLCTGQVFHFQSGDRDSFGWIEAANLVGHWEPKITQLAEALTERCLDLGDTPRAIEAAEAGLRVLPVHTGCTEALMRAHAAAGSREAVRRVYQAHVAALELIHLDQVADSTADLYEQLQSTG